MSEIKCPKCGSTQIHADKRGFKAGRFVAGTLVAGPLAGVVTGAAGKNKIIITCLACGHQFKPGQSSYADSGTQGSVISGHPEGVTYIKSKTSVYKCSYCGKISTFSDFNRKCPSCGSYIKESDKIDRSDTPDTHFLSTAAIISFMVVAIFVIVILATCV